MKFIHKFQQNELYLENNKSAKWHCGRHTLWLKKYMNDVWSVVLKNKNF